MAGVSLGPDEEQEFRRVVGARPRPEPGAPPSRAARDAMAEMARYRTGAPKGVFRYKSHEAANRDREEWAIARAAALASDGMEASRLERPK